ESTGGAAAAYLGVQKEVGQLRELVGELVDQVQNSRTPHLPDDASPIFRRLLDAGVSQCHASAIVKEAVERRDRVIAPDKPSLDKLVHEALAARLAETGPSCRRGKGKPTVIALVGPTGVGKTTTVAKLAANLKLKENATVALVTIDTYRIAAIDQLKKYADIIDAPLAVVSEPREVKDAIARVADHDFVIIDTAGRSPRDAVKLAELDEFLTAADPAEVHLVLSANHGAGSLKMALKRFSGLRTDRLCFTKLDEAAELGALVDVAAEANLPLSYVTHGQNVPADIEPACAKRLASLILEAEAETPAAATA
ncbi:MAG: flagellar GTP-binding protein, partial [Planctomycetota bacterium]